MPMSSEWITQNIYSSYKARGSHGFFFNWSIVDLQRLMCIAKWLHTHIYFFSVSFPLYHRLLKDIEYSSLCDIVGPCSSILYIVVCIY